MYFNRSIYIILLLFICLSAFGQEICNNGIDDDGDDLIDLNDTTDCVCEGGFPWSFYVINTVCLDNPIFSMATDYLEGISYQWYKDGIAITNESDPIYGPLPPYTPGTYLLNVETTSGCFSTEPYELSIGTVFVDVVDTFCIYETYEFNGNEISNPGNYSASFEAANGCDSIVYLDLEQVYCGDSIRGLDSKFYNNLILAGVDKNGDGYIQFEEAESLDTLSIPYDSSLPYWQYEIVNFRGIEYFTNLEYLDVSDHRALSLDLDSLRNLKHLNIYSNHMSTLKFNNANKIEYLNLGSNSFGLTHPDISHLKDLKYFIHRANRSRVINFEENQKLIEVILKTDLALDSIKFGQHNDLKKFIITSSELSELDLSVAPNLEYLQYEETFAYKALDIDLNYKLKFLRIRTWEEYPNFDVSHLLDLEHLDLEGIGLEQIDLSNNSQLKYLSIYDNLDLSSIDLSQNPELFFLDASRCDFGDHILDLSNNHKLDTLKVYQVKQLLIKNGIDESHLELRFHNWYDYVCVDESQYEEVRGMISSWVPVNSFCFFNEGPQFPLYGNIKLSTNGTNCDEFSTTIPALKFHIDDEFTSGYVYSSNDEEYSVYLPEGELCITPYVLYSDHYDVLPEKLDLDFPNDGNSIEQDFCIVPKVDIGDVEIDVLPLTPSRPGITSKYQLILRNLGTTTKSGHINMSYDKLKAEFLVVDSIPSDLTGDEIIWEFEDLNPFETLEISFALQLDPPPSLNAGDTLNISAMVITDDDIYLDNNSTEIDEILVDSFDPNDKLCLEGEFIEPFTIAPLLRYRIRFENTGTAEAIHVVIKDVIDLEKFDINTLKVLRSSHDSQVKIVENKAEFIFSEINLPFDDDNNDGYIFFEIRAKDDLVVSDTLSNTAEIFFDFNLPIKTNIFKTVIFDESVSIIEESIHDDINVYPTIINDKINITADGITSVIIFDTKGNIVKNLKYNMEPNTEIYLLGMESGTYFLRITYKSGIHIRKIIVIK